MLPVCRILGALVFILALPMTLCANFSDFDLYQKKVARSELEEKLALFLKKEPRLEGYFELSDEFLKIFSGLPTDKERKLEYTLELAPTALASQGQTAPQDKSLVGVKIALDPGHFGGPFAYLEERFIDIPSSEFSEEEEGYSLQFDEGTLSYLTASYLKILLEKEGAIVYLTRRGIGEGGLPSGFFDWLKENPKLWTSDTTLRKLFKLYNQADLYARAEKVNAFAPDLSVILHFNAHTQPGQNDSNSRVTAHNFNLVFIPGAFNAAELGSERSRYEFLRLLLGKDLYRSLALSRSILTAFTDHLRVPIVCELDEARYLESACLKVEEGIYARNLTLTRLIHGPLCYGESLIQNNANEAVHLSKRDFVIDGVSCSSRIKEVAEAYFQGIKEYLRSHP